MVEHRAVERFLVLEVVIQKRFVDPGLPRDGFRARSREQIGVEIQDCGRGMSQRLLSDIESGRTAGVGIGAMRERVRELGGTFKIDSNGTGTCVRVHLPLDSAKGMQLAS